MLLATYPAAARPNLTTTVRADDPNLDQFERNLFLFVFGFVLGRSCGLHDPGLPDDP
jgi:hypothetical protein